MGWWANRNFYRCFVSPLSSLSSMNFSSFTLLFWCCFCSWRPLWRNGKSQIGWRKYIHSWYYWGCLPPQLGSIASNCQWSSQFWTLSSGLGSSRWHRGSRTSTSTSRQTQPPLLSTSTDRSGSPLQVSRKIEVCSRIPKKAEPQTKSRSKSRTLKREEPL